MLDIDTGQVCMSLTGGLSVAHERTGATMQLANVPGHGNRIQNIKCDVRHPDIVVTASWDRA